MSTQIKSRIAMIIFFLLLNTAISHAAVCSVTPVNVSQYPFDTPGSISLVKDGKYLIVLDGGAKNIKVIETSTKTVTGDITLPFEPARMVLSEDGKTIYVTSMFDSLISEIDITDTETDNWKIKQTWGVESKSSFTGSLGAATIAPEGKLLFVADMTTNTIHVIDMTLSLPASSVRPDKATLKDDGNRCTLPSDLIATDKYLFVSCETGNTVSVFKLPDMTFYKNIAVGRSPVAMLISGDGATLYVASSGDGSISVINTATMTQTSVKNSNILTSPVSMTFGINRDGNSVIYIADRSKGSLVTFNPQINDFELSTCTVNGQRPGAVVFDLKEELCYVSHTNGIDFISMDGDMRAWVKTSSNSNFVKAVDVMLSPEQEFELEIRGGIGPFEVSGTGGLIARQSQDNTRLFTVTAPSIQGYGAIYIEDSTGGEIIAVMLRVGGTLSLSPSGPVQMELGGQSTVFQASGGFAPYSWRTQKGHLSSFSARYVIYTPSITGDDTITVCDSKGVCLDAKISVTISGVVITPAIAVMLPGEEKIFTALGGTDYTWDAPLGGTITSADLTDVIGSVKSGTIKFKAPDITGDYPVILTETKTAETAKVMVWVISDDIAISPATAQVNREGNLIFSVTGGISPYTWTVEQGDLNRTEGSDVAYTAPGISGEYLVTVRDRGGRTISSVITVGSDIRISPFSPTVNMGEKISFSLSGFQGDVSWSSSDGLVTASDNQKATWQAPNKAGTCYLLAADDRGTSAQAVIKVVSTNIKITPSEEQVKEGETILLKVTGGDAPYSWSAQTGSISASQGSFVYWRAPLWIPDSPVIVTAEDSSGSPVQAKLTVIPGSPSIKTLSNQSTYSIANGDKITLEVETFMDDGWDKYLLLMLPQGVLPPEKIGVWFRSPGITGITFDMEKFVPETTSGKIATILEFPLGTDMQLPKGDYTLCGAMVPQGEGLFEAIAKGDYLLDIMQFTVKE